MTKWTHRHTALVLYSLAVALVLATGLAAATFLISAQKARADAALTSANSHFQESDRQRQRAQQNLSLAMDALSEIYVDVIDNRMLLADQLASITEYAPQPTDSLSPRELAVLDRTLDLFDELLGVNEDDPAIRLQKGKAYLRFAAVHAALGDTQAAAEEYEIGIELLESVAPLGSTFEGVHYELAKGHTAQGRFLWSIDQEAAEAAFRSAIAILENPLDRNAANISWVRQLADTLNALAYRLARSCDVQRSRAAAPP